MYELDEDYLTAWIKAECEVMGWRPKVEDVATIPMIETT